MFATGSQSSGLHPDMPRAPPPALWEVQPIPATGPRPSLLWGTSGMSVWDVTRLMALPNTGPCLKGPQTTVPPRETYLETETCFFSLKCDFLPRKGDI